VKIVMVPIITKRIDDLISIQTVIAYRLNPRTWKTTDRNRTRPRDRQHTPQSQASRGKVSKKRQPERPLSPSRGQRDALKIVRRCVIVKVVDYRNGSCNHCCGVCVSCSSRVRSGAKKRISTIRTHDRTIPKSWPKQASHLHTKYHATRWRELGNRVFQLAESRHGRYGRHTEGRSDHECKQKRSGSKVSLRRWCWSAGGPAIRDDFARLLRFSSSYPASQQPALQQGSHVRDRKRAILSSFGIGVACALGRCLRVCLFPACAG
jgi:hypothetical protein